MARRDEGYTLVELIVVMLIFGIVMTLISVSFNRIAASSGQIMKSVETDIGGLIGLELLRIDLGFAGYGLPWSLGGAVYKTECESRPINGVGIDPASFNDEDNWAPWPPRAFVLGDNQGVNGSDYLVLKGSALGLTRGSRGWSYLNYSSTTAFLKPSKSEEELVPGQGGRVILINSGERGGVPMRELVTNGSAFSCSIDDIPRAMQPTSWEERFLVYGVADAPNNSDDKVSFPFNRADYYLGAPRKSGKDPSPCALGTASLYRGLVSQKGNLKAMPILDCVADLQVLFLLDTSSDGALVPGDISLKALQSELMPDGGAGREAQAIRKHVKEVRVFILAQQGKRDASYSYPVDRPERAIVVGDRVWQESELAANFGSDWRRYHWKLYTIAVQPKNLE